MDEQKFPVFPFAAAHLLQRSLQSICIQGYSDWVYAVFWRILPRNYPPPKWDEYGETHGRRRASQRKWILVWEDGFCNFSSTTNQSSVLEPKIFFRMSHEVYNYGEGLIGKVAAQNTDKWTFRDFCEQKEDNGTISLRYSAEDSVPKAWEAQFGSGIQTIALIPVGGGVVQLGSFGKVFQDPSFTSLLRKRFMYLRSIPGVLLPHPCSINYCTMETAFMASSRETELHGYASLSNPINVSEGCEIMPSMSSSLGALLSMLPSAEQPSSSTAARSQGFMKNSVDSSHDNHRLQTMDRRYSNGKSEMGIQQLSYIDEDHEMAFT